MARAIRRPVLGARAKDLMVGDAYTLDAAGTASRATANSDTIKGIVLGIDLNPIAASPQGPVSQDFVPATEAGAILGCEDNDAEYEVMIDTFVAAADILGNCELVDADGDTTLAQSRQSIKRGNAQFRLIELKDSPADNAAGAFARVIVRLLTTMQL